MSDRRWWGPATAAAVFGYFLSIYLVNILGASGPFVDAFVAPGTLALLLGAPLLEPLGLASASWIGSSPTGAGSLVLAILYTAAAWWLAWVLGALGRR
ncbi:MAG TPA: hypothetical protein VF774_24580 [Pseudoduganella sp.]